MKMNTACFTGGRPKSLYPINPYGQQLNYDRMVDNVVQYLITLYQEKNIYRYISGGAQGFDQIAFEAVEKLKQQYPDVQNIVYIPFQKQDARWSAKGVFSKEKYAQMLSLADEIKVCSPLNVDTATFPEITKALMHRNACMCNDSSICIGQYADSSWQYSRGGTANCLRYAARQNMTIHVQDFRPKEGA